MSEVLHPKDAIQRVEFTPSRILTPHQIGLETMASMRGDYYLWTDSSGPHIWAYDGYDSWDECGWHRDDDGEDYPVTKRHLENGQNIASGVSIHQEIMDEYVVMRLAEMIQQGTVEAAIDRVLDPDGRGGNGGSRLLRANADALKQAFSGMKMRPIEDTTR